MGKGLGVVESLGGGFLVSGRTFGAGQAQNSEKAGQCSSRVKGLSIKAGALQSRRKGSMRLLPK
jgi:hypothetical protein